ncbi:cyclophilin-like fold protein [Actinomyces sp. B33]|uniref:cyclophilin-like fold protein n=1 Tax=Actinomyces sp. B33 TaxID=2942131 RepID=UPI00234279C6|nr:cyclophilin-like fold protein [Actinomyces sp. B33]MDC4233732.1 cyclophilin-like fold protein [Actinomyces sp. B33]
METPLMYITANGNRFEVKLENNSSAVALAKALKSGPITIEASDYGNFEKVGDLGMTLPTNDRQITTAPGDVILYQGDKIAVYYDTNSWGFTKLGHIDDSENIKEKLGSGSVELTLSLI